MKSLITSIMMVLLIGLLAGSAFAQDADTGDKTRNLNYLDAPGLDANGGIVRNGAEFVEEGGPHGQLGEASEKMMFIDEDGDGFNDLEKSTDMVGKGNNVRNENQFQSVSGPHGPTIGIEGDELKAFGEDCDGDQVQDGALENERNTHGPGVAGPYTDSEGFGDASDQDVGDGEEIRSRGAGRR